MVYDGQVEAAPETVAAKQVREQSTIAFPYVDIEDAITVARTLLDSGGVPMDRDQLAAALGSVPNSGTFNNKLSAARLFGFIEVSQSRYQLTALGFEVLDPARERAAMAQGFLNVPLYRRTFDEFKSKQLPPRPLGLEQAFVSFGVSPKQKDKARWAFDKSARIAGYFPNSNEDRLVQPVIGLPIVTPVEEMPRAYAEDGRAFRGAPATSEWDATPRSQLHSSIQGMVNDLPPPKQDWSREEQADWLQALAQLFRVIYESDRDEKIVVSVERRRG